jgi:hypothetical protein
MILTNKFHSDNVSYILFRLKKKCKLNTKEINTLTKYKKHFESLKENKNVPFIRCLDSYYYCHSLAMTSQEIKEAIKINPELIALLL